MTSPHSTTPSETAIAADVVARTPGIFSLAGVSGALRVSPVQRGSSWLVSAGHVRDSLLVYADYAPWAVILNCPASVGVGQQVQLTATITGSNGIALLAPIPIQWSVSPFSRATITQDGVLQGVSSGTFQVVARERFSSRQRECMMSVP